MDVELIARGNPEVIRTIVEDFLYVEKDGIFLISLPKELLKYTKNQFKNSDIETIEYSQYVQSLNSTCKMSEISKINTEDAFKWLKTGNEFFYTISGSCFEMHSIDKKNVNVVSSAEPITKCFISNDGCIYCFIRGNSISFHVGDNLDLLWDTKLEFLPTKIIFSNNNEYVAICTSGKTLIYNLLTSAFKFSIDYTDIFFLENSIYISDLDKEINLEQQNILDLKNLSLEPKGLSCRIYKRNKLASFVDEKLQKIIYDNGVEQTTKNHTNVKKVDFIFTENRLFTFLIKNPGNEDHYSMESMLNGEVTSNSFDSKIIGWAMSDNYFAVQQENCEMKFFLKEKRTFTLVNTVKKQENAIFAIKNFMCCLFDSFSNSIEFYDRGELRTTFSHPGCTQIKWSESGLYVATFSYSVSTGSLVQIFNCDGTLMYKKVYNSLKEFNWRSFPEFSEEEKKKILTDHSLDEIEEPEDEDIIKNKLLLKEWIDYLKSKINKND